MAWAGPLLQMIRVTRCYPSPDGSPLTVLDSVSLELGHGESLAIIGPSGSGKSTLLQILGTLDQPTSGEVVLEGCSISGLPPDQLAAIRNRQIGFVFQAHYLLPQCTVLENVLVPTLATEKTNAAIRQHSGEPAPARARRLLARGGLADRLGHRPGQLSGGERQRVAVVRALVNQPQFLLADEPTGSLDHLSATSLAQLLLELNREENVALVIVTHSAEMAGLMGRGLLLKDGRLSPAATAR